jgi:endonuclease/exonuclease/phosphatase family metal-dependent hydrolase
LNADIVILQEAGQPGEAADTTRVAWFPVTGRVGVAVVTRNGFEVKPSDGPGGLVACHAVDVRGPERFSVLAVWTQQKDGYISGLAADLDRCSDWMAGREVVIAGDFNSNAIWDKASRPADHSRVVARLEREFGLISAYHAALGVAQGAEPHATHYWRWQEANPFHLDYCFVPTAWKVCNVSVGEFAPGAHVSDHRPVIVDVEIRPSSCCGGHGE